jgi:hypothetical protein
MHATLLEAIARAGPPLGDAGAVAFLAIHSKLPPELRFALSKLVARRAAEALAIGCGDLAEDAPGVTLPAGGAMVWWGAAARGRNVLPLLRHFPPAVRGAALARLRGGGGGQRASDAALERCHALLGGGAARRGADDAMA